MRSNKEIRKKKSQANVSGQVIELNEAQRTRVICVLMVLQACVSFRSVPRILDTFRARGYFPEAWTPHFTSVINWTLRLGLSRLQSVKPITDRWIAIIDHSIDIGVKKVLVVLRVPLGLLQEKDRSLKLIDCECIGIHVSEKTDFETVAQQLTETFSRSGSPAAIVKDNAGNLSKGVGHWKKLEKIKNVKTIDDVSHVLANSLKAQFEKKSIFKSFLATIRTGSARLRQTELAYLLPPKIRTKGRFHSISKIARWGETIISVMKQRGRAEGNSELEGLRKAFPGFSRFSSFLERFGKTTIITNKIAKLLKHKGLNQKTYRECKDLALTLPPRCKVRRRILKWLNTHLSKQSQMGMQQTPLLVCSDVIESLFGKFKHIIERSSINDINRMALAIPALCGTVTEDDILKAFSEIKHEDIVKWENENITHTLRGRRQDLLKRL